MSTNENDLISKINQGTDNKKKSSKKIPIIILIVILIIIAICAVTKICVLKSKGQRFIELLTEDQYAIELVKNRNKALSSDGERKYNVALSNNFLTLLDSSFSLLGGDLTLDANTIRKGNNFDTTATLKLGNFELQSLDVVKEKDTLALSVPNLFDGYIAVNNDNLEEIAKKLGFISGDEFEENEISEDALKILKKYGKILATSIINYIETQDSEITINENKLNTKCHSLIIGEKELAQIELKILEKLKDDDETIEFIVKIVKENEEISDSIKEEFTNESLKEDILDLYNKTLDTVNTITGGRLVLKLEVYELNEKNVKTILTFYTDDREYVISLASIADKEKDYIVISFDVSDMILNLEYEGKMLDENYAGGILASTEGAKISILDINIEKIEDSQAKIRKIKDLNALLLNKATDEELEKLKNEIESNLGISEESNPYENFGEMVYEEGEFVLNNPEKRVEVLEVSRNAYNKINPGMTKDEVISIMGEPDGSFETSGSEYVAWYYGDSNSIYLISVALENGVVDTVYNDIASNMKNNVQVSIELGTEIEDLIKLYKNIEIDMKKEDVISILGDKYVEIYKDKENYFALKWYDKKENSIVIEFNNEGKVFYINNVSMDA